MKDYALGKRVLEYCNHPQYMTAEGDDMAYNALTGGYLGIHHPSFITLDLEESVSVRQISMKLIDWEDECNESEKPKKNQHYAYRLLCSEDKHSWKVLYDTTATDKVYRRGWQWGVLEQPVSMRYFRIHALHNPANSGFHVVRLRLFDEENPDLQRGDRLEMGRVFEIEEGDAVPISVRIMNLVQRLSDTVPESKKEGSQYRQLVDDVLGESIVFDTVDGRIDQFRQVITPYMAESLEGEYRDSSRNNIKGWMASLLILAANILMNLLYPRIPVPVSIIRWLLFGLVLIYALYMVKDDIVAFVLKLFVKQKSAKAEHSLESHNKFAPENIERCTQTGGADVPMFLFNDEVGDYDIKSGFHCVPNPGSLEIVLKKAVDISYLRFLLWDNCGSKKKQPSRRKYHYRLLVGRESEQNGAVVWDAVYDNSHNPSNGWQEFFFEAEARRVKAIKIQFLHSLALSNGNNENTVTQIVSIQAYENPSENICKWTDADARLSYAPAIKGLSRNKIVLGGTQTEISYMAENRITSKIQAYLKSLEGECSLERELLEIKRFESELNTGNKDDINKQILFLRKSIFDPVNEKKKQMQRKSVWISFVTLLLLSIEFLDISDEIKFLVLLVLLLLVILPVLIGRKSRS